MAKKKVLFTDLVNEYKGLLLSTKREGIGDLIDYLEECKFFDSPCSGGNHLAEPGGLLRHSLNVLHIAEGLATTLYGEDLTPEITISVTLAALLHDVGKMGQFEKPGYLPNILKSGEQSTSKPYEVNKDLLPVDHEIRSIAIISMFIDLTEDEQFAILYHNGLYGQVGKYALQGHETPLYMIIHWSDMWASRVIEKEDK